MVSLKIEMGKKNITWVVLLVAVLIVGVVYAYGGSNPVIHGHSINEIEGINNYATKDYVDNLFSSVPSSSWPAGSYCILANGGCPSGFQERRLSSEVARPSWHPNYHDAGSSYFGNDYTGNVHYHAFHMELVFCCK